MTAVTLCASTSLCASTPADTFGGATATYTGPAGETYTIGPNAPAQSTATEPNTTAPDASTLATAPTPVMPSGFLLPTKREWTGDKGGSVGDPKQPWTDTGNIFGYLASNYPVAGRQHIGIDIRTTLNEAVYAIADGTIYRYINASSPGDRAVFCKHQLNDGTWFYAVYGHTTLKSGFSVGQAILAGQQISYTADSNNTHVHFGINLTGNFSNGWGRLDVGLNPDSYGWRPPRTWMLSHTPKNANPAPGSGPHLTITAVSDKTTVKPGETFIVTYTVTNDGSAIAQSISLTAAAPNYAIIVGSTPAGSLQTNGSSCIVTLPQLNAGARTTVTVTYKVL